MNDVEKEYKEFQSKVAFVRDWAMKHHGEQGLEFLSDLLWKKLQNHILICIKARSSDEHCYSNGYIDAMLFVLSLISEKDIDIKEAIYGR